MWQIYSDEPYVVIPLIFVWAAFGLLGGLRVADLLAIPLGSILLGWFFYHPYATQNYARRVIRYYTVLGCIFGGAVVFGIITGVMPAARPSIGSLQAIPPKVDSP